MNKAQESTSGLARTPETVVLVGANTCSSRWIKYEIDPSKSSYVGNGLLGIDISKNKDLNENTLERCGILPRRYPFYLWNNDDGYTNMGDWIEATAKDAGR